MNMTQFKLTMSLENKTIILNESDLPSKFVLCAYEEQKIIIKIGTDMYLHCCDVIQKKMLDNEDTEKMRIYFEQGKKEGVSETYNEIDTEMRDIAKIKHTAEMLKNENNVLQNEIKEIIDRQKNIIEQAVNEKLELELQKRLYDLKLENAVLSKDKEQYEREKNRNDELTKLLHKTEEELNQYNTVKSSKMLGGEGETEVEELFQKYVEYEVQNTAAKRHAGDFHVVIPIAENKSIKVLIDAKKYNTLVNNISRDKLFFDVDSDDNVDCGMMISLTSNIAAVKHMQIHDTKKQKPILYLVLKDMTDEMKAHEINAGLRILKKLVCSKCTDDKFDWMGLYNRFYAEIDKHKKSLLKIKRAQSKLIDEQIIELSRTLCDFNENAMASAKQENNGENENDDENTDTVQILKCAALKPNGKQCGRKCKNGDYCATHFKKL